MLDNEAQRFNDETQALDDEAQTFNCREVNPMVKLDRGRDGQLINQILHDRYSIQSLLGRKTGRRTFLASDLATDLPVVIKLLLFSPDFTWDDLKLFEREAETLKALDHPAIPRYLDFFEVETALGQGFVLVQSYIEARSLQEWVQTGCTFSEHELKAIAKELLDILEYLHSRQPPVIHRDIKPSNVLLRNRSGNTPGEVYLVDFGSVQTVAHGGTVTVVGTYGYMPPEQFGGRSLPASDLYGLGATLIYLATGQHPADLPQNDSHIEFKQLTSLSRSFVHWIEWMTNPSLTERPTSAQDAIQNFLKPHEKQKDQLSTRSALFSPHPSFSISLEADQSIFELKVLSNQIQYFFPEPSTLLGGCFVIGSSLVCACLIPALLNLLLGSITWYWIILYGVVNFSLFKFVLHPLILSSVSQDEKLGRIFSDFVYSNYISSKNAADNNLPCANVIFRRENDSIISTLKLVQNSQPIVIFRGELQSISVGSETETQSRLHLSFQVYSNTITLRGTRQEIQWLCDELTEWSGIQAQRWEMLSA